MEMWPVAGPDEPGAHAPTDPADDPDAVTLQCTPWLHPGLVAALLTLRPSADALARDLLAPVDHMVAAIHALPVPEAAHRNLDRIAALGGFLADVVCSARDNLWLLTGALDVRPAPVRVHDVVDRIVRRCRGLAAPGVDVAAACDRRLVIVFDAALLQRVLSILVFNAIQHTHTGSVEVSASLGDAGTLELRVVDSGPGVAESVVAACARRGGAAHPCCDPQAALAVGLRHVVRVVDACFGRVSVENGGGGGAGCTVVVSLPAAPPPGGAGCKAAATVKLSAAAHSLADLSRNEIEAALLGEEAASTTPPPRREGARPAAGEPQERRRSARGPLSDATPPLVSTRRADHVGVTQQELSSDVEPTLRKFDGRRITRSAGRFGGAARAAAGGISSEYSPGGASQSAHGAKTRLQAQKIDVLGLTQPTVSSLRVSGPLPPSSAMNAAASQSRSAATSSGRSLPRQADAQWSQRLGAHQAQWASSAVSHLPQIDLSVGLIVRNESGDEVPEALTPRWGSAPLCGAPPSLAATLPRRASIATPPPSPRFPAPPRLDRRHPNLKREGLEKMLASAAISRERDGEAIATDGSERGGRVRELPPRTPTSERVQQPGDSRPPTSGVDARSFSLSSIGSQHNSAAEPDAPPFSALAASAMASPFYLPSAEPMHLAPLPPAAATSPILPRTDSLDRVSSPAVHVGAAPPRDGVRRLLSLPPPERLRSTLERAISLLEHRSSDADRLGAQSESSGGSSSLGDLPPRFPSRPHSLLPPDFQLLSHASGGQRSLSFREFLKTAAQKLAHTASARKPRRVEPRPPLADAAAAPGGGSRNKPSRSDPNALDGPPRFDPASDLRANHTELREGDHLLHRHVGLQVRAQSLPHTMSGGQPSSASPASPRTASHRPPHNARTVDEPPPSKPPDHGVHHYGVESASLRFASWAEEPPSAAPYVYGADGRVAPGARAAGPLSDADAAEVARALGPLGLCHYVPVLARWGVTLEALRPMSVDELRGAGFVSHASRVRLYDWLHPPR